MCVCAHTDTHGIPSKEVGNPCSLNFHFRLHCSLGFPFLFSYIFSPGLLGLKIWLLAGNGKFVWIVQYYFVLFSLMRGPVLEGYHSPSLFPDRISGCRALLPQASATLTSFPWSPAGHHYPLSGALCPDGLRGQEAAGEGFSSDLLTAPRLLLRSESTPIESSVKQFLVLSCPLEIHTLV